MGLGRTLKRNQEKLAYKKFQKLWNKEQRYQQHLIAEGKLPEGQPILKRKPTLAMWKAIAVSAKAKAEAKPTEVQEFADENDLAWNEDEEKGEGTQEK
jgi:hypothetical protein